MSCFTENWQNDILPDEILQYILWKLPSKDLLKCTAVCKTWRRISECERIWAVRLSFNLDINKRLSAAANIAKNKAVVQAWQEQGLSLRKMYVTTRRKENFPIEEAVFPETVHLGKKFIYVN
jgi:hypothetical protein